MKTMSILGMAAAIMTYGNVFATENQKTNPSMPGDKDHAFIVNAASGGLLEVKLGQMAAEKAKSPDVKAFGQRMVTDHTKANEQLKQILEKKGITPPATVMEKQQKIIDAMTKRSGEDFDKAYMEHMVKIRKDDISDFERMAKDGNDKDLKAFAETTLPVFREHLKTAEEDLKTLNGEARKPEAAAKKW